MRVTRAIRRQARRQEAATSCSDAARVALDKGVDAKTFDEAIDMRKIAAGNIG